LPQINTDFCRKMKLNVGEQREENDV